jgi:type I restriction enzyme S subunit
MGDPRYFGGSIPFVKISDVTASDRRTLRETAASVTEAGSKRSRLIPKGSLILSNSGTICVPIFLGVPACIHDGFVAFEGLPDEVSQEYLFHFFNYVRPHLRDKHKQGVTQVNLNTTIVGEITIPLPPLAEQKQ